MKIFKLSYLWIAVLMSLLLNNCCDLTNDPSPANPVDSATYSTGVLLYDASQGISNTTEFNSEFAILKSPYNTNVDLSLNYADGNPYLLVTYENVEDDGYAGVQFSVFKKISDQKLLPEIIGEKIKGIRFNAKSSIDLQNLSLEAVSVDGSILASETFQLREDFSSFFLPVTSSNIKKLFFKVESQSSNSGSASFSIDDIYLDDGSTEKFSPPSTDEEFLAWLKKSSFNFFDWNYLDISTTHGAVAESANQTEKISLSGIGFSYAIYVVAARDGLIASETAKSRIRKMLQWQVDQNWYDGTGGWFGFPHHYFRPDGTYLWAGVSTIDWAMCAAGIRVVKQYYTSDATIVALANELLNRPDWAKVLDSDNKIAMGFDEDGTLSPWRWGLAFSEETELIYLEAVASGDLNASIFDAITREKKSGYYPSWFGAGFTYNWLQLFTGPIEPFKANSVSAYTSDASTCQSVFGRPLMGLTACSTVERVGSNGFLSWSRYIGNQGAFIHGTSNASEVVQLSPAPYGAALALPFIREQAISGLREFVKMGYYHEYLGLPDNVRIVDLIGNMSISPNWDPFDINIGPIILAIEQVQTNSVGTLYTQDPAIQTALQGLIESFPN